MTPSQLSRTSGLLARSLRASSSTSATRRIAPRQAIAASRFVLATTTPFSQSRFFSFTNRQAKGILPDSDDPAPPNVQDHAVKPVPAELSDQEYHDLADDFLHTIQDRLEEVAEKNDQVDVEYSAGVLNVTFPEIGTYVINKQPPNKQIWLSSPISGPKRYDYVVYGEGQAQKEDTAVGDWVYLRDGSTIKSLFLDELNVNLALPLPH